MNTQIAMERADRVQAVQIGTKPYNTYLWRVEHDVTFPHFERMDPASKRQVKIIHAANGLPHEMNFYLKYMD